MRFQVKSKGEIKMRIKNRSIFKPRAHGSYKITAGKKDEAIVYLYDEISWFGIQAEQFVKDFNAIESKTIHLRVNSPGGSVFDGTAIFNVIKQHSSKVIAYIDGLAASIASVIVMAADEVRAGQNAFFMIHEPWSIVIGDAEMMRAEADLLEKVSGTLVKAYTDKSGLSDEEVHDYMAKETWFTAQEALDAGFVDVIEEQESEEDAKAKITLFDLSAFANVPDGLMADRQPPTERELERILRDAGCSAKQSKEILAKGLPEDLRDVDSEETLSADVDDQRDVDDPAQRDVEPPQAPRDPTADLLMRAEIEAPST